MSLFWFPLDHILFVVVAAVLSLCVHGFAHAWTAWKLGDATARQNGQVSLNPKAHLDVMGSIMMLLAGVGWPKGTSIHRGRFNNPRLMTILVNAAGPLSNLILVFISMLLFVLLIKFGVINLMSDEPVSTTLFLILKYLLEINMILFLFNLIPLPPLDAYRVVEEFLPWRLRIKLQGFEQWTFFLFLLIVFIPPLRAITFVPLDGLGDWIINGMYEFIVSLVGGIGGPGTLEGPSRI